MLILSCWSMKHLLGYSWGQIPRSSEWQKPSPSTISHYYIHIPFCRQKCPYCKFALTPVFDEFKKKRYIEYLKKEIREYFLDSSCHVEEWDILPRKTEQDISTPLSLRSIWQKLKTIYFGWGTPSVLSLDEVQNILECFPFYKEKKQSKISRRPQIQDSALMTKTQESAIEITFECNPEDITIDYVVWLFWLGINRLSIGVQSLNNDTLKMIHRSDEASIIGALDCIREAIFLSWVQDISVNIDFILGLPCVTQWELLIDIKRLHIVYPFITHTSVYILEKWLYPKSWKSHTISDLQLQEDFLDIVEYFETLDWNHYELSNWARSWYESRHNQSYWDHSEYRGFGLSAASYIAPKRFSNSDAFSGYYKWGLIEEEVLTPEQLEIENLMFWLRTSNGYDIGNSLLNLNNAKLDEFISRGLLICEKRNIKLTKTWIFLIDYIMSELISS